MMFRFAAALAVLAVSAMPAMAQSSCGSAPIAPAIPSASDIGKLAPDVASTTKHDAYTDVKKWQGDLKSYRDGLSAKTDQAKADMAEQTRNGKADKAAALKDQIDGYNKCFDSTVDTEQRVVGEYVAMSNAYCARSDVDRSTCPKK